MALKKSRFEVPENRRIRLIIDTDIMCEADDHYAVAHAIMTPKFEVKAVLAEHFGNQFGSTSYEDSENQSYEEARKFIKLMGLEGEIPVLEGCKDCIQDNQPVESEASRFIVEEAMKDDPKPLFIICQGATTNLASALLMEPKIAEKMTVIWIGGGEYPKGGHEFNLGNDVAAANVLMNSTIELWQVPSRVYGMMKVSFNELFDNVYPCGELGKYMVENVLRVNQYWADINLAERIHQGTTRGEIAIGHPSGEIWRLGDSAGVGLMLDESPEYYTIIGAPTFDTKTQEYILNPDNPRKIRVYHDIDAQYVIRDFFSKMKYYFGE